MAFKAKYLHKKRIFNNLCTCFTCGSSKGQGNTKAKVLIVQLIVFDNKKNLHKLPATKKSADRKYSKQYTQN
jgi:hypothetical protein